MEPEIRARHAVKLKGVLPNTLSWVRILEDGRIELEYYDRHAGAEDHSGGDVAWMYRIAPSEETRMRQLLAERTKTNITNDRAMLAAFANSFRDAWAAREWLRANGVAFEEQFDSWP